MAAEYDRRINHDGARRALVIGARGALGSLLSDAAAVPSPDAQSAFELAATGR